jgi:hypothetical protein
MTPLFSPVINPQIPCYAKDPCAHVLDLVSAAPALPQSEKGFLREVFGHCAPATQGSQTSNQWIAQLEIPTLHYPADNLECEGRDGGWFLPSGGSDPVLLNTSRDQRS